MIMNYEASTLAYLNQKTIPHFNAIQEQDLNQREYYKEFIPFVSATSSTYNYKHQSSLTKADSYFGLY